MQKMDKILVFGSDGMVGSAIIRSLNRKGYKNIIAVNRREVDLLDQRQVANFFKKNQIDYVFLAAAKVGGILANNIHRADFIYQNLEIQNNVIHQSYRHKVKKLLFLGSSCIYPKFSTQPIVEESLLTAELEKTNEYYAIAKIAGIKMCEAYRDQYGCNFISCMPTNLYGQNDNYNLQSSHVLPALIRKFHEAKVNKSKEVVLWGSGSPRREFLYVDDLADACVFLMQKYDGREFLNIGTGSDVSVKELADLVSKAVGYKGNIVWDTSKPDGTPKKLLDVTRINKLGWKHKISIELGIRKTYKHFLNELKNKTIRGL
jgi:GDP-L-fucose synthase